MQSAMKHVVRREDFVAADYLAEGVDMDLQEIKHIREVFELLDPRNTGLVDLGDLASQLQTHGVAEQNPVLFALFKSIPNERAYQLDWAEFLGMMRHRISENNSKAQMKGLFDFLTINKADELNLEALKLISRELGEDISEADLAEMLRRADLDHDGRVSFEDFWELMRQKTFA